MGLMSLIARKINPDRNRQVRAPPYERQATSRSPVRRVDSPLPSKGAGAAEDLGSSRSPTALGDSPTLSSSSGFRSTVSNRPSTAPIGNLAFGQSQAEQDSSNRDLPASRPVSPTSPRPSSQFTSPQPLSSLLQNSRSETPTYLSAARHRQHQSISSSRRASTIRTNSAAKRAYVDLLDAQSAINPADFRTRVQAAGARDYGEDVADRNIIINGLDVQATKAQSLRTQSALDSRRPLSCEPPDEEDEYEDLHRHVLKQASIDTALWTKSLSSSGQHSKSSRQSSRHQSLNALPTVSSGKTLHKRATPSGSRSLQISISEANQAASHQDSTSPAASPIVASHPSPRYSRSVASFGRMSPTMSVASKHNTIAESIHEEESNAEPRLYVNELPVLSPQPTSYRISAFTDDRRPSTTQSISSSFGQRSTTPDVPSLPRHLKEKVLGARPDWLDDVADRESAPSPSIKKSRDRSHSQGDEMDNYAPIRGVASPPRQRLPATLVDDAVPVRSSSIRHWSISSATPTTSSSGSTNFHRPQSQHTASTSVDLNSRTYSSLVNSSFTSLTTSTSIYPASEVVAKGKGPQIDVEEKSSPGFNIDDYISDDDSFTASPTKHSVNEEDLLFDSGYGANGIQLPGLEDAFGAPAPVVKMRKSPLSTESFPDDLHEVYHDMNEDSLYSTIMPLPSRSPNRRHSASLLDMLALDHDLSFPEDYDIPRPKTGGGGIISPLNLRETVRMTALMDSGPGIRDGAHSSQSYRGRFGSHHTRNLSDETIEEESIDRLSISTAIRLRKEAKSRNRASQISSGTSDTRHSSQSRSLSHSSTTGGDDSTDTITRQPSTANSNGVIQTDEESNSNYQSCNSEPLTGSDTDVLDLSDVPDLAPDIPRIHITAE